MSLDTRELFARLIQCEAGGEGENGMAAVATVVMNRATATVGGIQPRGKGRRRTGRHHAAGAVHLHA